MKKVLIVVFCILGMIVGMALGQMASGVSFLQWLSWGGEFGIQNPMTINLGFLQLTIGFWCKINVAGVIGMVALAFLSKKIFDWLKL